jgi:hypothetical protein
VERKNQDLNKFIRETSKESFLEELKSGGVDTQLQQVYSFIRNNGPVCDSDIVEALGISISSVTARRNYLLFKLGLIRDDGVAISSKSGKRVHYWGIK